VFWWTAETSIDTPTGFALLVLAEEGAYANDAAAAGEEITFGRIRVRLRGMRPNTVYKITHPYGVMRLRTDDRGRAREPAGDIGCEAPEAGGDVNCNFAAALRSRVSKAYLRWDPRAGRPAPRGFLGNVNRPHRVVGSPRGTNYFKVEGPGAGGAGRNTIVTRRFAVSGQIAGRDSVRPVRLAAPNLVAKSDTGNKRDNVTTDRTPTFVGRAEDASRVKLFVDGKRVRRQFADKADYELSRRLAPGVHRIKVTATDSSGNVSRKSKALRIRIAR
ncbi:MAG: Ig-like domain-containing protein, partial [Candidatus Rokuibacteriota bacterium]